MNGKWASRIGLAVFFTAGGITHFTSDRDFASIVPPALPYPLQIVWATGVMELLFAAALLQNRYLPQIGFLLSLYLLAVLPANIYMAVAGISIFMEHVPTWAAWARIPLQFPLIALILWATEAWPLRRAFEFSRA